MLHLIRISIYLYANMNQRQWLSIATLVVTLTICNSSRILLVFPVPSSSHFILGSSLARGLASAGHDVTLVAAREDKIASKNGIYKQIVLKEVAEEHERNNIDMFNMDSSMWNAFSTISNMLTMLSRHTLNSTEIKQLIKSDNTFDVVVIEEFMTDSLKVLPYLFKASYIAFSSMGPNVMINDLVCNPSPLSYVPEMSSGLPAKMTFFQRVKNLMVHLFGKFLSHILFDKNQKTILKEYYPDAPEIDVLKYNASLVLLNSHVSTFQPVPMVPNMISIGGYHVQPPKALPTDLQAFLDNAKEGVVYFSMGSILKSKDMPQQKLDVLMGAFKKLKQKVLWKWEADDLPAKPDNVLTRKWLPQQDILAHPNVKLFITHGGLLSSTETIYHGKPVLAIPIFGDQPSNAQLMVNNGIALSHKFSELSDSEIFLSKMNELLDNPKYFKNAQTRSKIMHDQPMTPMETAVFWIEYVIRHKGAPHLRVAGLDLPWYQYHLLDVLAFVFGIALLALNVVLGGICFLIKKKFPSLCSCKEKPSLKVKTN